MIKVNNLKYKGQNLRLIYILVMLTKFKTHLLSAVRTLRWCHEILSGPGVDELLCFLIALLNSTLEKGGYLKRSFIEILSSRCKLTCQF